MPIKWEQWMFDLIADTKLTAKEIAERIGTTPHAVYQQRSKCGIRQWKKPPKEKIKYASMKWPPGYRVVKRYVMQRDNYKCVYCGGDATEIDHVIPKHLGGLDLPPNLVAACSRCNNLKGTSCADCSVWRAKIS